MQQTIIDLATQHYGNPAAVAVLIEDNPGFIADSVEFELTDDVTNGACPIVVRDEDDLKNKKVLKEFEGKIIVS